VSANGRENEFLLWFDEIGLDDRASVGGKGASLGELRRAGIDVPPGFIVTASAFRRFASRDAGAAVPAELADAVAVAYRTLCGEAGSNAIDEPVAVRSSATDEDGADASFAGLQDTYLWVRGETAVAEAIGRCWASLYNDEAVAYRARLDLRDEAIAMGVVVQRMVNAHAAGVMFTRSPLTGDPSVIAISSSFGLGSAVVGGEVTPDEFLVDKVTGVVRRTTISRKEIRHVPNESGSGTREEPVPEEMQTQATLDAAAVARLVELGRAIEKHYGCAQDIEWALEPSGDIFILQSRPETVWSAREREAARKAALDSPKEKPFDHVFSFFGNRKA
jgi:pyruvate,water dikinase